jgi:hypothetical protein
MATWRCCFHRPSSSFASLFLARGLRKQFGRDQGPTKRLLGTGRPEMNRSTRKPFVVPQIKEQASLAKVTLISGGKGEKKGKNNKNNNNNTSNSHGHGHNS